MFLAPSISSQLVYYFEDASSADEQEIAQLHKDVRVVTDTAMLPDYTSAAVAEGYFRKYWTDRLGINHSAQERTVKAVHLGTMVGFSRFGVIDVPEQADPILHDRKWGELHQIYIIPQHQKKGLGGQLFAQAAKGLAAWGCDHMMINVLEGNVDARGFYEHQGALHFTTVIEHNRRNGTFYKVPCALYRYDLH